MNRRDCSTLLAAATILWPCNIFAQIPARRLLIGFLLSGSKSSTELDVNNFTQGMRQLGYLEDRDYAIEPRSSEGDPNRLPHLAEELLGLNPNLIIAGSTPAAVAAKRATSSIPIVGLLLTDPVGLGLVASEAHPGTNVTGSLIRVQGLPAKQLELALDLIPGARTIGLVLNSNNPSNVIQRREVEAAAARLGLRVVPGEVRTPDEIGAAFSMFTRNRVSAIIIFTGFIIWRRQIAAYALASRLPTVFSERDTVEAGGLISYGINRRDTYRRAAYFVDRILKGDKPADLPVEFPTKLELVINLATARAIGLTVPPTLLAHADEVIE